MSTARAALHLSLPVTLRPRDGGSDRSDRVSQSHMSSFFFDTALLPTLLGILELECMHHRRSISCDRNAAPRLGKERDEKREVGRGRMEGRGKREGGQVRGLPTSCQDQSLKRTGRWSEREEFERTRVKVRKSPFLFLRVATLVNILLFSNHPLRAVHGELKWIPLKLQSKRDLQSLDAVISD